MGGPSGQTAGMFHLVTHAFFKALLFLAAGSVIHAMHHASDPNDLRQMGGLGKRMRLTAATCLIGVLALAGFPGLSGFWSKDAILGVSLEQAGFFVGGSGAGAHGWAALIGSITGLVVAAITAFYAMRMWLMAFWGEPRSESAAHAHESPAVMTIPLVILAIPSLLIGFMLHQSHLFAGFLQGHTVAGEMHWNLAILASLLALAGMGLAWRMYAKPQMAADPIERMPAPLYRTFAGLWGMDGFWNAVGARGTIAFGRMVAWVDRNVVDGAMNGIGWLTGRSGALLRRTTSGQAQSYAAVMVGAILVLAVLLVLAENASRAVANTTYKSDRTNRAGATELILEMPKFQAVRKAGG
jgi:NADH-quinone oxidoreductase subunit L